MPLTEYQRAFLKDILVDKSSVIDPDTGDPVDWDNLVPASILSGNLVILLDGGGAPITTGVKQDVMLPFAGIFTGWTLLADQPGAIQIDIWKDVYANFPPLDADSITGGDEPAIVATAQKAQGTDLSAWTVAFAAGDVLRFNVDSVSAIARCSLALAFTRS